MNDPIPFSPTLRLNTLGFLPDHEKYVTIVAPCTQFSVRTVSDDREVLVGTVTGPKINADTDEPLYCADLSAVTTPGTYYLIVAGVGRSVPFQISYDVYRAAFYTVMRGMYLWRCGIAVSAEHNGQVFSQQACHVHDAFLDFVDGEPIRRDATGGWHDAGDYNKYVVNAGVTVGILFLAWEQFSDRLQQFSLDLPESGNGIPDFLSEIKWEVDWLLKMQAEDGSVYHKLSTRDFGGFVLPEQETANRFLSPWSSAATADFVAMTAIAARVFRAYDAPYADRCQDAAIRSYRFLQAHPENHMADLTGFTTGAYQTEDSDDRLWAAVELWETTGHAEYRHDFESRAAMRPEKIEAMWDWSNVANLGMITYFFSSRTDKDRDLCHEIQASLIAQADAIVQTAEDHGYGRPLGTFYNWGCNGTVARQTVLLQSAYRIAPRDAYVETALRAIDHLLGRNYYGRSFVTGVGHQPPRFPHDRRSGGDLDKAPWPGYLIGGGWPSATDWRDEMESYETNEIAINWNAALVYALAGFLPVVPALESSESLF